MILTVAIVAATNLLSGMANTNRNNITTLQAYYYAVEGLEAVRNIRDSNWLHNQDWLSAGSVDVWGSVFTEDEVRKYELDLKRVDQTPSADAVDWQTIRLS